MADFNNRSGSFKKYDNMSTEELQQILRDDASNTEGQGLDMDELLYVLDVLAGRRKAHNEGKTPEEALESFKRNYHPDIYNDSSPVSATTFANKPIRKGYWKRGLIAVAAMIAIVISCTITADAWGFNLWDTVAKWTQETFHFGYFGQTEETNAPTPNRAHPCVSLQEALDTYKITAKLVPSWLPDGYVEESVDIVQTPKQRQFLAAYQCGSDTIRIFIIDYLDTYPFQVEQSDALMDIHSVNGIDYLIFDNEGQIKATWIYETYECQISGPISIEQLKEMIDSIEKG